MRKTEASDTVPPSASRRGFFSYLFGYVPSAMPPDVPREDPPDPNADRELTDGYRSARRVLVGTCAVSIAWATAQLNLRELQFEFATITLNLENASITILLGLALLYFTLRWVHEFAMMERHVRRWRLAQLDVRSVSLFARFSLLALAAGALDRSIRSALLVAGAIGLVGVASLVLALPLTIAVMPLRMRARRRAGRESAANASIEALFWGGLFAVVLASAGTVALAVTSYLYEPLRAALWKGPPNPVALAAFVVILLGVFLSRWLLRPVMRRLFAERPDYYTEPSSDGAMVVHYIERPKEPLL